jgi:hypothetical protein
LDRKRCIDRRKVVCRFREKMTMYKSRRKA